MILVDTSVWVEHLRSGNAELAAYLMQGRVVMHPHVEGELALGNLRQRVQVLDAVRYLPRVLVATDPEVLVFIQARDLHGSGIGYVDAHLLAAVCLAPGTGLWTFDRRLHEAATRLGVVADVSRL